MSDDLPIPVAAWEELQADLQISVMDVIGSVMPGPGLYKSIRRVVEARVARRVGEGRLRHLGGVQVRVGEEVPGVILVELGFRTERRVQWVRVDLTPR